MRSKKAVTAVLSSVLVMGSLLGGCAGSDGSKETSSSVAPSTAAAASADDSKPKEKIQLDFWTFWGSTTRRPIIEKIISDFNGSQDRIKVKHTFLPYGDVWTKELAAIAAGSPPDVIINEIARVGQRADKKQVMSLQKYLDKEDISGRFFKSLWEPMKYKNEVYALPFNTDTRFMFYNKQMFKDAGLDPEKPPKTWAELEEVSKKLEIIKDGKIERLGFHPRLFGLHELFMVNADKGLPFVDDKGVHINTPEKIAAMEWYTKWDERLGMKEVDLFKSTFGSKTNDPLISGKVGIKIEAGTFWTQIRDFAKKKEDFGVAPVPEFKEGNGNHSFGGGFTIEIPYGAKNPDASWEFLKYMTDVAAQKYWAQFNFDNVSNIEASNDPELIADPVYKFAVENLKWTTLGVTPLSAPDFGKVLNPEIDAIMLGKQKPADGLNKGQKAVEDLVKQNTK